MKQFSVYLFDLDEEGNEVVTDSLLIEDENFLDATFQAETLMISHDSFGCEIYDHEGTIIYSTLGVDLEGGDE